MDMTRHTGAGRGLSKLLAVPAAGATVFTTLRSGVFWGQNVLVAVAYMAAALVGQWLILSPGYASPLWPAAGVALAALLIYGGRCWPSLWSGCLLVDAQLDTSVQSLAPAALIATGVTLQAFTGARLTRHFFDIPLPLVHDSEVRRFLLLAGPLACLISATIGIATLYGFERLPLNGIVTQWLQWWSGDVLGVLLIGPLVLMAWPGKHLHWARHGGRIVLQLLIMAVLLVAGHLGLSYVEESQAQERVETRVEEVYENAFLPLQAAMAPLYGVQHVLPLARR